MPKLIEHKVDGKKGYVINEILYNTNCFTEFLTSDNKIGNNYSRFIKAVGCRQSNLVL